MPKNFVRRTYDAWIHTHARRFRYPPWIAESRKHGFTLRFQGLAPQLTFQVHQRRSWGPAELMIHDEKGVFWDIIGDFDLSEVRTADGRYRCEWCQGGADYPSRAALWEAHVFEPLLDWVNQRTADQWVCLYGTPAQDVWGARLLSFDAMSDKNHVKAFPLVTPVDDRFFECFRGDTDEPQPNNLHDTPALIPVPEELHHHKIEVIFWPLDMEPKPPLSAPTTDWRRRSPPAALAGKVRELGDVMNSAPASDWRIDP